MAIAGLAVRVFRNERPLVGLHGDVDTGRDGQILRRHDRGGSERRDVGRHQSGVERCALRIQHELPDRGFEQGRRRHERPPVESLVERICKRDVVSPLDDLEPRDSRDFRHLVVGHERGDGCQDGIGFRGIEPARSDGEEVAAIRRDGSGQEDIGRPACCRQLTQQDVFTDGDHSVRVIRGSDIRSDDGVRELRVTRRHSSR
ncbi:MAG: hypothetical protein BWY66_01673 [bacterium ADurb.Bin374]|nr:MAG: hypothetical protein BWY66_01673 [bacterium ADurb.Bin374]